MILKDVRDYLDKLAREDPNALYKPFVVRNMTTGTNYPVRYIDEGQNPVELGVEIWGTLSEGYERAAD